MFATNKISNPQKPTLKAYQQSQFKLQEREELKNLHRNLKI